MIRNILTNFSARLSVAALNFFMMLLTTHYLGKDIRGEISMLMVGVAIIHLVSDLAGGPSLVYLVPRTSIRKLMITGIVWSFIATAGTGWILLNRQMVPTEYSKELFIIGILISLHSLNQNILLGQERIRAFNFLFIFQGAIQFLSMCIALFLFHQHKSYPYLYSAMAGNGLAFLTGLYLVSKKVETMRVEETRNIFLLLFMNGYFTQFASLSLQLCKSRNFNVLQSTLKDGKGAVGIYSTAFSLSEAILLLSASAAAVTLSRVANNADHKLERNAVLRLGKFSFILTSLAVIFFVCLPSGFYTWLLGKDFSEVKNVFITLTPGILLLSFSTVFSHYFSGAGKHYMNFLSSIFALGSTWLLSQYMVDHFGTNGAGYTSSLSYVLLAGFIFAGFMIMSRNRGEWKILIPSKEDLAFVKNFMKRNSGR
ncbi:MAG: hypothetical protein HY064_04285 [Bacteroidetes bacterium]|nr:hypothetical protein [Bacteroidota bacterium]